MWLCVLVCNKEQLVSGSSSEIDRRCQALGSSSNNNNKKRKEKRRTSQKKVKLAQVSSAAAAAGCCCCCFGVVVALLLLPASHSACVRASLQLIDSYNLAFDGHLWQSLICKINIYSFF